MNFKNIFSSMKKTGIITGQLDMFLLGKSVESNDRAIDVNAPSQAGKCMRANYYARMGEEINNTVDARTQRIFDNGHSTHERIQNYLTEMEILELDEVPIIHRGYNIQGHTDGFIRMENGELAILEIKTINEKSFFDLKDAKEEHKMQGMVYLYCAEERRQYLRMKYKTEKAFNNSYTERADYFKSRYQHLKSGSKFTKEQKIKNEVELNLLADNLLFHTEIPVSKVIFLYENKNTQELKEYVLERNSLTEPILKDVLSRYSFLNRCVERGELPEREGKSKSDYICRWCSFKDTCWTV